MTARDFSLKDLEAMPKAEVVATLQCGGNRRGGLDAPLTLLLPLTLPFTLIHTPTLHPYPTPSLILHPNPYPNPNPNPSPNQGGLDAHKRTSGNSWGAGAISNAKWGGVYLRDLLLECGLTSPLKAGVAHPNPSPSPKPDPNLYPP